MRRWVLLLSCVLATPLAVDAAAAAERLPQRGVGLTVDLPLAPGAVALFPETPADAEATPSVVLRARVRWADVEPAPGLADWSAFDRLLTAADARGVPLVVTLTGPGPLGPGVDVTDETSVVAWSEFVRQAARRAAGRVAGWQIWEHPNDPTSWGEAPSVTGYAFLAKRTALVLRGESPNATIALGTVAGSPSFLDDVLAEGVAPYVDALAIDVDGAEEPTRLLEQARDIALARDPSAAWWVDAEVGGEDDAWSAALAAFERPRDLTFFDAPVGDAAQRSDIAAALASFSAGVPEDAAPSVEGARPLVAAPGEPGVSWTRHVVASDLSQRVVLRAVPTAADTDGMVDLEIRDLEAGEFHLHEPTGRHAGPIRRVVPSSTRGALLLSLPRTDRPVVLAFARAELPPGQQEALDVRGTRELSVEEILARHLARQAARDRALDTLTADLVTDMRYQLGASQRGIDVRVESRYFQREGGETEIENLRYFVGGAPYEPKRGVPEIPLIQPEKVTVGPLAVHLDRSYEYELRGTETLRGREAYVVAFRPLDGDARRVQGTVWIDRESFDRLRLRSVRTALEPPILSNAQTDDFIRVDGEDGIEHLVVGSSRIERVVSVLGASVVVRMDLDFGGHVVNAQAFEERRREALASSNQMLRDTDEGYQYLSITEDGSRVLSKGESRKILAVAGARFDESYDGVLPLGGVNWLDNDWRGRGLQLNLFLAGAINTVSLFDPSLFGSDFSGGFDAFLPVVRRRDRLATPGEGVVEARTVRARTPSIGFEFGTPLGRFGKAIVGIEAEHQSWSDTDDTAADFREPEDTVVATGELGFEYHRGAWDFRTRVGYSHRFDWEPWGPGDGTVAPEYFEEGDEDYWTWRARLTGTWLFGGTRRLGVALDYLDGEGLDRFSQYEFAGFGGPDVAGFSGSGIHFDRAALLRVSYGFDVLGRFGLEGFVDYGLIRNEELPAAIVAEHGREGDVLGVGLSGTLPGPWSTLIQVEVGHALQAEDYASAEGDWVAQVLFLKLLR